MIRFLRTASTRRLLATIGGALAAIAAGTAIAVAATGSGPVPRREPLALAIHQALSAGRVTGVSANVSFTNNLIDSSDFAGQSANPILQGATGRMWVSDDGRMRIELQSDDGDAQVVVDRRAFWISDPSQNTVYEGTLPAQGTTAQGDRDGDGAPTVARIQALLMRIMGPPSRVDVSAAQPTDVAGRAAYQVTIAPAHDGGLLGSAQVSWDAETGVPLQFAVFARGNATPVLQLKATSISYGSVPPSVFGITPPAGATVVRLGAEPATMAAPGRAGGRSVRGVAAVAAQLPFSLEAPRTLVGLPRREVSLVRTGGGRAAVVVYGENLGGMVVIEAPAPTSGRRSSGGMLGAGLDLPTVSINGARGQELSTALGTVLTFTRGGVSYTVTGSVPATAAELAARAL